MKVKDIKSLEERIDKLEEMLLTLSYHMDNDHYYVPPKVFCEHRDRWVNDEVDYDEGLYQGNLEYFIEMCKDLEKKKENQDES